jgi:hypothetical protein
LFVENEELRKSIKALDNITEESGSKEDVFISKDNKQKVLRTKGNKKEPTHSDYFRTLKVSLDR